MESLKVFKNLLLLKRPQRVFCYLLIQCLFFGSQAFADTNKDTANYFLALADIHFDPFIACQSTVPCPLVQKLRAAPVSQWPNIFALYDIKPPKYRFDSSYPLLVTVLDAEKQIAEKKEIRFVLALGDFLAHQYRNNYKRYAQDNSFSGYQAFVKKTMQFLTNELNRTFPNKDVYALVGNNDSYHRDYYSQPGGNFLHDTAGIWSQLIKTKANKIIFAENFPVGGYYAVDAPGEPNLRIIMLNTVLFSRNSAGKGIVQAANNQLDWLQKQLELAKSRNQRAIIAMHIPSSIDFYATLRVRLVTLVELWQPNYTKRFLKELSEYSPQVMIVIAGHLHSEWFQVLSFKNFRSEIPITGVQSISPIFGNDPGFKTFGYSPESLQLKDFFGYYYPLNKGKKWLVEHDARQTHSSVCYNCPIVWSMNLLEQMNALARYYKYFYSINSGEETKPK